MPVVDLSEATAGCPPRLKRQSNAASSHQSGNGCDADGESDVHNIAFSGSANQQNTPPITYPTCISYSVRWMVPIGGLLQPHRVVGAAPGAFDGNRHLARAAHPNESGTSLSGLRRFVDAWQCARYAWGIRESGSYSGASSSVSRNRCTAASRKCTTLFRALRRFALAVHDSCATASWPPPHSRRAAGDRLD